MVVNEKHQTLCGGIKENEYILCHSYGVFIIIIMTVVVVNTIRNNRITSTTSTSTTTSTSITHSSSVSREVLQGRVEIEKASGIDEWSSLAPYEIIISFVLL